MENRNFLYIIVLFITFSSCVSNNNTVNETCFKPFNGIIREVHRTSGLTFIYLKKGEGRYDFFVNDTTCCTYFHNVADSGDSVIRKGNYLELHHKNTISNWYISNCDDIPYTTDSINYAYAKGIIYKIAHDEVNENYHYRYTVNNKEYTDYSPRIDNAEVGDTFVVAYNKDNPELNRIFNRKFRK